MFSSCRLLTVAFLLVILATGAPAQHWSRAFGPMGLDGPDGWDGEAYCFGEWQGKLVVGGWLEEAGDVTTSHVALWNGEYWEGFDVGVNQIPAFVQGTPFSLYIGGPFWEAGGESHAYCVRWDGSWHAMPGLEQPPTCGTMVNDHLWIGGSFVREEIPSWWIGMKQWYGGGWVDPINFGSWDLYEDEAHAITDGFGNIHLGGEIMRIIGADTTWGHVGWSSEDGHIEFGRGITGGHVECFQPDGGFMWVGGTFSHADGQQSEGLVEQGGGGTYFPVADASTQREVWDMTMYNGGLYLVADEGTPMEDFWVVRHYGNGTWSAPLGGEFTNSLKCIGTRVGTELFVGGFFKNGVVRWDDNEWVHLGGGIGLIHHDRHWFKAFVEFEGEIIAAGDAITLPAVLEDQYDCQNVVRWDGDAWHRLSNGIGADVTALAVYDDELYAAMASTGGSLERVQRWDGQEWQGAGDAEGQVLCLTVHEGELIAGGHFTSIDGTSASRVAAYDGIAWRALGAGMTGGVRSLYSNNGVLYAAGGFEEAGGEAALRVASFDGESWHAMGDGFADGKVYALTAYDGEIHAGGSFTASGETPLGHVARWDGAQWQPLGEGVTGDIFYGVAALRGTTTGLYVGGDFTSAGGAPATGLALWDGAWSEFGGGVADPYFARATVSAFLVHEGDLWVGGQFTRAGDVPSYCIAQWKGDDLVPNLLNAFNATPGNDGTVVLAWQVAPVLADAEFLLTAATDAAAWEVPFTAVDATRFAAHDTAPGLAGATAVHYVLAYHLGGRRHELDETSVRLTPPAAVRLNSAAPNPFNPATRITFVLDREEEVRLEVYDLAGRRVATLAAERFAAGSHTATWRGCDESGRALPSGAYVVRLVTDSAVRSQKVMLAR